MRIWLQILKIPEKGVMIKFNICNLIKVKYYKLNNELSWYTTIDAVEFQEKAYLGRRANFTL